MCPSPIIRVFAAAARILASTPGRCLPRTAPCGTDGDPDAGCRESHDGERCDDPFMALQAKSQREANRIAR